MISLGFPGGSESACNAGDPSSFPGSGRCAGEGIGYPLQYCCTLSLTKEARIYNGLKTISLTSGAGNSGQPLVKE